MSRSSRHILVTGSHRSGTTWVGKTVALHPRVEYVHEPFHAGNPNKLVGLRPENWFEYVPGSLTREDMQRKFDRLLKSTSLYVPLRKVRTTGLDAKTPVRFSRALLLSSYKNRLLLKDPLALLSAGWLHERYGLRVVCMIRAPLAFVGSLKKAQWGFDFHNLSRQKELMRGWLSPFRDEIQKACDEPGDLVDQGVLAWNVLHYVILDYQRRYPSWLFVRYEDLANDPLSGFRGLYDYLGLRLGLRIEETIVSYTREGNPAEVESVEYQPRDARKGLHNWKQRLSPEEVERVKRSTQEIAAHFYENSHDVA